MSSITVTLSSQVRNSHWGHSFSLWSHPNDSIKIHYIYINWWHVFHHALQAWHLWGNSSWERWPDWYLRIIARFIFLSLYIYVYTYTQWWNKTRGDATTAFSATNGICNYHSAWGQFIMMKFPQWHHAVYVTSNNYQNMAG